jgi:peptide/nickel transport system ATP-binding protein
VAFIRAVDGVDLDIPTGKSMGLIGESGCGKTTVGRCILQLLEPTEGAVSFRGSTITGMRPPPLLAAASALFGISALIRAMALVVNVASWPFYLQLPFPHNQVGLPQAWAFLVSLVGLVAAVMAGSGASARESFRPTAIAGLVASLTVAPLAAVGLVLVILARREFGKGTVQSLRKDMQIVFQDPFGSLNPRMLVRNIVGEPLAAFRRQAVERYPEAETARGRLTNRAIAKVTADLIARVGLNPEHLNRFPHEFSGGQRQRICVARALALKPAFIVLDEPTSALDVSVQAQILNLLKELQRERSLTYLFISHHLAVIRHMCDDIAVMYLGKIVERAPNEALFRETLHPYTIALLSAIPSVDPESRRERIVLEGEIPSPANPPSGCRFHTRCNFAVEREVLEVDAARDAREEDLIRLADPLAAPNTVRLVVAGAVVDPLAALGTVAYEVAEAGAEGVNIRVKSQVERGTVARVRYRRYREACATAEPPLKEARPGHAVACHFWEEALAAQRRAEAEGRTVGAVVAELRAPLPPTEAHAAGAA